ADLGRLTRHACGADAFPDHADVHGHARGESITDAVGDASRAAAVYGTETGTRFPSGARRSTGAPGRSVWLARRLARAQSIGSRPGRPARGDAMRVATRRRCRRRRIRAADGWQTSPSATTRQASAEETPIRSAALIQSPTP